MNKIVIVGCGYVGKGTAASIDEERWTAETYDGEEFIDTTPVLDGAITVFVDPAIADAPTLDDVKNDAESFIICVPTPRSIDGSCDVSIVKSVVDKLVHTGKPILIKSTIDIDYANELADMRNVAFSPEFLRGRHAIQDSIKENRLILGMGKNGDSALSVYWSSVFQKETCISIPITSAALAKYAENTFLAMRVTFFNELYKIAEASNVKYDPVVWALSLDPRVGNSHSNVPGYDGQYGWGGHCLPKDTSALITYAERHGVNPEFINAMRLVNTKHRGHNPDYEDVIE